MRLAHLAEVVAIEAALFPRPWQREHFLHELQRNDHAINDVWTLEGRVLGYLSYWLLGEEIQLNKIAVAQHAQRRGLGRTMMRALMEQAGERNCSAILLEVREANQAAIALYRAFEFRDEGKRADYYGPGQDALLMARRDLKRI